MDKQITRREFLRGLAAGSGVALLAACGSGATPAAQDTSTPVPPDGATTAPAQVGGTGSTVNITYWGSFSDVLGEAEQAMVNAFNTAQQDVVVEYQYQGSYEDTAQKFTAALQAQAIPDVILLSDVWWFKFYLAQAIAPLDDLAAQAGVDFSDYQPVLLNEGVRDGVHYWIPFARSTPLFYYNKDIWAEVGLPDRAPRTWDEFGEWAPQLVQRSGNTMTRAAYVHPGAASYIAWLFQGVIWQFGGRYSTPEFEITLNEPDSIRAAQFFSDTVNNYGWAMHSTDINREFIGGQAASMMASTGALAGIQRNAPFAVGVGFLPEERTFGCPTGGAGLAIPAGASAEKQQAAMAFIAFATSTDGTITWSQSTGYMPVRISAVNDPKMQAFFEENPNFRTAVEQLPKTQAQDAARVFIPNGDQIIGRGLERIVINRENVERVWQDVTVELEEGAAPVLEDLEALRARA